MTKIRHIIPDFKSPLALKETALRKSLQLDKRARADAKVNLPASDDTDLNEPQLAIITACQQALDDLKQWRARRLAEKAAAIAKHDLSDSERDFQTPLEDAQLALQAQRQSGRQDIVAARVTERRHHREREAFRRANRLYREARYPEVPLLTVAFIFIAFLLETGVNTQLFAQVSDFGAIGGAAIAALMSIPNLLLGLGVGYFSLRFALHVNWVPKSIGLFSALLGIAAIIAYNLYVAHYRRLIDGNPDGELLQAWTTLLTDPFAFLAIKDALILFIIGLITACIMIWKGFDGFSDRYPGYAPIDRTYQQTRAAYEDSQKRHMARVQEITGNAIATIDDRIKAVTQKLKAAMALLNDALIDVKTAQDAAQENVRVARRLLKTYREENARIRTLPAPAHFQSYPAMESDIGPFDSFDPEDLRDQLNHRADALRQEARDAKAALRAMTEQEINTLPQLIQDAEGQAAQQIHDDHAASPQGHGHTPQRPLIKVVD